MFVVESIQDQRIRKGKKQYLLSWVGYEEMTWQDADKCDCIELIEQWEVEHEEE